MELDAISQPELDQIQRIGSADLVVGIFDLERQEDGSSAVTMAREALAELSKPLRTIVVCNNGQHGPSSDAPKADAPEAGTSGTNGDAPSLGVFSCGLPVPDPSEPPQQSISNAYKRVFAVAGKLGARACGVVATWPHSLTSQWISRLVHPILDLGFDLVAPCYTRQKTEGLLNRSVLAPLHRALYGEQLQNPMGPDFGLSGNLLRQIVKQDSARKNGADRNALASIAAAAACGGYQVCEVQLGVRAQRPTDWANLSSLLADVLGATFLEMEGNVTHWQSIRGSKSLPRFALPEAPPEDTGTVDVAGMIETFRLGTQNLQDVWGVVLPPTTLLELRRLSRLPQDQFRIPDQLWVRIIYDFALGYRQRAISRDHLLRSITPLYLGWIASYAIEMQTAGLAEADARIERLAKVYEDNKSYLVSRWRWPDRFNP